MTLKVFEKRLLLVTLQVFGKYEPQIGRLRACLIFALG